MKYLWFLTAALCSLGCETSPLVSSVEDARIAELAKSWPPRRDPQVDPNMVGERPLVENRVVPASAYRPPWEVVSRREWDLETAAVDSLGRIGEAAVPHMVESLHSGDPDLRLRATKVLARIGPDAQAAVNELVRTLEDPVPEVRRGAVLALGQIGPAAAEAVEPLVRVMGESEDPPPVAPAVYQ
jgi:HEAT repeat protein